MSTQCYASTTAKQFAPGNFVTEGTSDKIGVTLGIEDDQEANPLVRVRWVTDLSVELVRSEYLYLGARLNRQSTGAGKGGGSDGDAG
jgi:hypothetical protein